MADEKIKVREDFYSNPPMGQGIDLPPEILKILCDYALESLKIRQSNVPHLVMENVAPEMLERIVKAYVEGLNPTRYVVDSDGFPKVMERG